MSKANLTQCLLEDCERCGFQNCCHYADCVEYEHYQAYDLCGNVYCYECIDPAERKKLRSVISSGNPPLPDFLRWIADRFVHVYDESENVDFVQALKRHADNIDEVLGKDV